MQAKLLRVVEDKEFERVGGTQTIKTDVKIIAATNLDIEKAIEQGTFREDLYYRLNIIPLILPPLRERKDDIPLLAEHFIRKICKDLGVETKRLEPGVLDLFMRYNWPGNVRELEATIHRAIVMSNDDTITRNDFYGLFADAGVGRRGQRAAADAGVGAESDGGADGDHQRRLRRGDVVRRPPAHRARPGIVRRTHPRSRPPPRPGAQHAEVEDSEVQHRGGEGLVNQ